MTLAEELQQATAELKRYGVGWSPGVAVSGGLKAQLVGDPVLDGGVYDHGPLSFWWINEVGGQPLVVPSDSATSFGEALLDATKWILDHYVARAGAAAQTLVDSR